MISPLITSSHKQTTWETIKRYALHVVQICSNFCYVSGLVFLSPSFTMNGSPNQSLVYFYSSLPISKSTASLAFDFISFILQDKLITEQEDKQIPFIFFVVQLKKMTSRPVTSKLTTYRTTLRIYVKGISDISCFVVSFFIVMNVITKEMS